MVSFVHGRQRPWTNFKSLEHRLLGRVEQPKGERIDAEVEFGLRSSGKGTSNLRQRRDPLLALSLQRRGPLRALSLHRREPRVAVEKDDVAVERAVNGP